MTDRQLIRRTSSFTSGAAKWGSLGRASGIYNISNSTGFWTDNANIPDSTIECWFKTSSAISLGNSSTQMLLARYKYYWLGLDSQGVNLYYGLDSAVNNSPAHGALIFPGALCDGQWHHVAAVFSGGGGTAYCDGVRLGSDVATPVGAGTDIETVGGYGNTSEAYDWNGSIDEIRYSNIARYSGATYTVPTGPFVVDVNTVSLFHMEGSLLDATTATAPPVAAFTSTVTDATVVFDGSSSTSADSPLTGWLWDFGDGFTGSGEIVTHHYGAAGTPSVKLTVTDAADGADSVSHTVSVAPGAGPDTCSIGRVIDALTAVPSLSENVDLFTNVVVVDGPWPQSDMPAELVMIGLLAAGDAESGGDQAPRTFGAQGHGRIQEDYGVVCEIVCWAGDADASAQPAMRNRVLALFAAFEVAIRVPQTFFGLLTPPPSGQVPDVWIERMGLTQTSEDDEMGRTASLQFAVHVRNSLNYS